MTRREIAVLACKFLALWMFAQGVLYGTSTVVLAIATVGGLFTDRDAQWRLLAMLAYTGVPALCVLVAGIVLWKMSGRLAGRMVSDDPTPVTREDISAESVMSIAFAAVGVFVLVPVLRGLAGSLVGLVRGDHTLSDWADASWHRNLWSSIVGLAFALWLILGSRGIVKVIRRYRTAGPKNKE